MSTMQTQITDSSEFFSRFNRVGIETVIIKCLPNFILTGNKPLLQKKLDDDHLFIISNAKQYPKYVQQCDKQYGKNSWYPLFDGQQKSPFRLVNNFDPFLIGGWKRALVVWVPCGKQWFTGFIMPERNDEHHLLSQRDVVMDICKGISLDIYHGVGRVANPYYRCQFLTPAQQKALEMVTIGVMINKDAAQTLKISIRAFEDRIHSVRKKMSIFPGIVERMGKVRSQTSMTHLACQYDLI